jgi:hypothetical protein
MNLKNVNWKTARGSQTPCLCEPRPDGELWEPAFERWLRLADVLLAKASRSDGDQNQPGVQEEH